MSKFTFKNFLLEAGKGRGKKRPKRPLPGQGGGLEPGIHHHHAWKKEDVDRAIANNRANPNAFPLPDFTKPPVQVQQHRKSTDKPQHWTDEFMDPKIPYRVDPRLLTLGQSLGLMDRWNHPRFPTERKMSELFIDEVEMQRLERLGYHVEVMIPPRGNNISVGNSKVMVGPKELQALIRVGAEQFVESHVIMKKYDLIAKTVKGVRESTAEVRMRWDKTPPDVQRRLDEIWINLGIWFGYGKPGAPGSKTISFTQFLNLREKFDQRSQIPADRPPEPAPIPSAVPVQGEFPLGDPRRPAVEPSADVVGPDKPGPEELPPTLKGVQEIEPVVEPSKPMSFLQMMKGKLFGREKEVVPGEGGAYTAAQRAEMFPYKAKDLKGEVIQGSGLLPGTPAGLDYKITTDIAGKKDFYWGDGSKSQAQQAGIQRPEARDITHITIETLMGREGLKQLSEVGDKYPNTRRLRTSFMSSDGILNMVLRPEFMSRLKLIFPKLEQVYGEIVLDGRMEQGRWVGVSKDTLKRFQDVEHIIRLLPDVVVTRRIHGYEQQGHGPIAEIHFKYDTTGITARAGRPREAPFDPAEGGRGGRRLFDRGRLNITVNPTLSRADAWGNEKAVVPKEVPLGISSGPLEKMRPTAAERKQLQDAYHSGLLAKKPGVTVYPVNTTQRFEIDKRAAQFHKTGRTDWSNVKPGDTVIFDIKVKPFTHAEHHFPEHTFTRINGWVSKDGRAYEIGHTGRTFSYMRAKDIREPSKIPGDVPTVTRGKSPGLGIKSYLGLIKWAQQQGLREIRSGGQVSPQAGHVYRALKEMGFEVDIFEDRGQSGNYIIHVPKARLPESAKPVLLGSDKATFDNFWRATQL